MKREIKFRAFDDGKMLSMPISSNYGISRFFGVLREDAVVMQFTGMLDCDGKEIYENDVVQTVSKDGVRLSKFQIIWSESRCRFMKKRDGVRLSKFQIIWSESRCRFMKKREDESYYDLETSQMLLKIIGNIYENPKLIEAAS